MATSYKKLQTQAFASQVCVMSPKLQKENSPVRSQAVLKKINASSNIPSSRVFASAERKPFKAQTTLLDNLQQQLTEAQEKYTIQSNVLRHYQEEDQKKTTIIKQLQEKQSQSGTQSLETNLEILTTQYEEQSILLQEALKEASEWKGKYLKQLHQKQETQELKQEIERLNQMINNYAKEKSTSQQLLSQAQHQIKNLQDSNKKTIGKGIK